MSTEEARNCSNLGQWARHEDDGCMYGNPGNLRASLGRKSDVKGEQM